MLLTTNLEEGRSVSPFILGEDSTHTDSNHTRLLGTQEIGMNKQDKYFLIIQVVSQKSILEKVKLNNEKTVNFFNLNFELA